MDILIRDAAAADLDGDGMNTSSDARLILRAAVGLESMGLETAYDQGAQIETELLALDSDENWDIPDDALGDLTKEFTIDYPLVAHDAAGITSGDIIITTRLKMLKTAKAVATLKTFCSSLSKTEYSFFINHNLDKT